MHPFKIFIPCFTSCVLPLYPRDKMNHLLNIDWSFFEREYLGESVSGYFWFGGIILATLLLKKPIARLVARISSSMAVRLNYLEHKATIGSMLFKPIESLLQIVL